MKVKNMCYGKPLPLIFFFSLPLMLGNVFQQLYTLMDTVIVSQKMGVDALAALGSCEWINWLGFSIMTGFAQGFSILVSNAFGRNDASQVQKTISALFMSCAVVASGFVLVSIWFLPFLLRLLDTPHAVFEMALLYARMIFLGLPITMFYNATASVLRALGNSRTPLVSMVMASIVNIVLDVLFVNVWETGIVGAAVATLIAQLLAGGYCLWRLFCLPQYVPKNLVREPLMYVSMLKLGVPMALQNVLIAVGGMVLTRVVNQYGTYFLAGFTAINKLYGVLEISAVSYGYAMVTYVGQNYGAKKYQRIQEGVRSAMVLGIFTSLFIGVFLYIFGNALLSLFVASDQPGYDQVMKYAWNFLSIMALFLPILYLLHIYRSAIQGLRDTLIPMLSGFLELLFRIGTACLLPIWFHESGLYPVEVFAWFGAVILLVPNYYWKQYHFPKESETK